VLSCFADTEALPWVRKFLDDSHETIRLNGLVVLRYMLHGPVGDATIATAKELFDKADSDSGPEFESARRKLDCN
jgi:hypothetical protein